MLLTQPPSRRHEPAQFFVGLIDRRWFTGVWREAAIGILRNPIAASSSTDVSRFSTRKGEQSHADGRAPSPTCKVANA
jgi:hypothetical protein